MLSFVFLIIPDKSKTNGVLPKLVVSSQPTPCIPTVANKGTSDRFLIMVARVIRPIAYKEARHSE